MPPAKKPQKTPTERAREHAEKAKAISEARRNASTPGPGGYDPSPVKSSSHTGAAAFKSATDRSKLAASTAVPNTVGDPGAYETAGRLSLAQQASSTFHKSSKSGARGFGGTSKRELKLANRNPTSPGSGDDVTPGAGTYDPTLTETGREANMNVMSDGEKMKSSAFASNSAQRGKFALPQAANPGAGTYSPEYKTVEVRAHPGSISKTGRDHHFVSDNLDGMGEDSNTQAHVGPGSYNSHVHKTISHTTELAGHSLSASVISEVTRPASADLW